MELMLRDGDYVPDGAGGLRTVEGADALLQQVLFRLQARRGGLPFLPELGSRLYLLPREKASARPALARQYTVEALADIEGLSVEEVNLSEMADGALTVRVQLVWKGAPLTVEVEV